MSKKRNVFYKDGLFFDKKTGEFWNGNKDNLQRQGDNDIFLDINEYHLEMDFVFSNTNLNFTPLPPNSTANTGTSSTELTNSMKADGSKQTINTPRGTIQINRPSAINKDKIIGNDILLIPFQFFKIKSITDRTPNYNSIGNLFSRFEKINVWQNTDNLKISLEVTYLAIDPKIYNEDWVDSMVSLYKALALPVYIGGAQFSPPPRVFLKLGDFINNVPFIVTSIKRSSIQEGMFTNKYSSIYSDSKSNYLPKFQKISLDLTSAYSQSSDNTTIDFKQVLNRDEGVSQELRLNNKNYSFGIKRGNPSNKNRL